MSNRLTDLTSYKGVLPYSSEIFGVYHPLLGWKSERIRARVDRGSRGRTVDVVERLRRRLEPRVEARYSSADCQMAIGRILPGIYKESDEPGSLVLAGIKEKLVAENEITADVWERVLGEDFLQDLLEGPVTDRAQRRYTELCSSGSTRLRELDPAQVMVGAMLARESQIAGMLRVLQTQNKHQLLEEIFFGRESNTLLKAIQMFATTQDPFDTIDPTSELDRVGLSPIGVAHLFRQYFFELDTFIGTPVGHVWIAPGAQVELIEVHTRRTFQEEVLERSIESLHRTEKSLTTQDELSDAVKENNRSGTKVGADITANQDWGWGSATESASFGLDNSQEKSREQVHTTKREQSEKLTTELKQNFKSTFRTVTEVTDTSTKRYFLTNHGDKLVNYELRRKMRQVAVQVQDIGSYLCWQTYVDDPGANLGLAKLVHVGVPPDLSKIPEPEMIVPPEPFSEAVNITIPFLPTEDGDASNDEAFAHGKEVDDDGADNTNWIQDDFKFGPFRCSKPGYTLASVAVDPQGADATLSTKHKEGNPEEGYTFVVHLDRINFNEQNSIPVKATLNWDPDVDEAAIKIENDKRMALFTAREREKFRNSFLDAAQERIELASNIIPRKFENLREEERIVVYRSLIQDMLTPSSLVPQPDKQTQHVVAELINSIFDVNKMLYFVAPEWWRPRLHHSHQELGNIDSVTDPVTGEQISYDNDIPKQDITSWGEADIRTDSYYITKDSTPAKLGSSLGWLLQLDGDDLRNAFLNAPWVKAVMPIRPGKELAALSWLKSVEGMQTIGEDDMYHGPEPEFAGKTIFEVLDMLAEQVAAKHQEGLTTADYADPIDDSNTVRATPIDRVYEHGFDPLKDGFRSNTDGNFEVFDQWVEILPTDQVVAVEVEYNPKTGRQI